MGRVPAVLGARARVHDPARAPVRAVRRAVDVVDGCARRPDEHRPEGRYTRRRDARRGGDRERGGSHERRRGRRPRVGERFAAPTRWKRTKIRRRSPAYVAHWTEETCSGRRERRQRERMGSCWKVCNERRGEGSGSMSSERREIQKEQQCLCSFFLSA